MGVLWLTHSLTHSLREVKKIGKIQETTQSFWCLKGHISMFYTYDPQILGDGVKNWVAQTTRRLGFVHPWTKQPTKQLFS